METSDQRITEQMQLDLASFRPRSAHFDARISKMWKPRTGRGALGRRAANRGLRSVQDWDHKRYSCLFPQYGPAYNADDMWAANTTHHKWLINATATGHVGIPA